ncbi:hypothetical protein BSP239C_03985 [Brevibacterium sp. 239c]|nr:hypothetical protein BSP239C_03985 [Brevibacterium sp. 239c]
MTGHRLFLSGVRPLTGHLLSTPMTDDRVQLTGHPWMPTGHSLATGHTPLTEGVRL